MDERERRILDAAEKRVHREFAGEGSGHDHYHILRVRDNALRILEEEGEGEPFSVELLALLHDVGDPKFFDGDPAKGKACLRGWMKELGLEQEERERFERTVDGISFKGSGVEDPDLPIEGRIVRDADRLDAMGAIGIARTFSFGGSRGKPIHIPDSTPSEHASYEEYLRSQGPTIDHFHEKLLHLKDRMDTKAGKRLAAERHRFMEEFLERFHQEWEGKA